MAATSLPRGRPRSSTADHAILDATLGLLAEGGYEGLTTDAIAARAGVSKATIYRRWSSKDEVVLAAASTLSTSIPTPDTGTLRGDLEALALALASVFSEASTARLVSSLVEQLAHKPQLATALREGFLRTRRDVARIAMQRAQARGEIGDAHDLEVAVDLLAAPFYYRMLITGAPIDVAFAHQLVDACVTWLTAGRPDD